MNFFRKSFLQYCSVYRRCMSSNSLTKVAFANGIKTITLASPQTRNTLSISMEKELLKNLSADWENKDLRVIVLDSEGPLFSAGHNLNEMTAKNNLEIYNEIFELASKIMFAIIDCPVPVIAKVKAGAFAAGCQLVAQCDIALCTPNCKFATPGANVGIFCSTPGIAIARCVHPMVTRHMLFTGLPLTAHEANANGLIFKVCEEEDIDKEVDHICQSIMSKSRAIIMNGKRFYYKQVDLPIKEAFKLGEKEMINTLSLKDTQEGIDCFLQKRKPQWCHSSEPYKNK
ncbi:hypothetical protein RI129_009677 [Pyrocoelia pectoralis]|uniref:Enoyl-CoA hydratase domain-containing protein 3, mitochondrial n=1 Tax=Pyrocoelia pectoralis TaxID=417401 RepID=A0AAN7V2L9_9COLE